jgi:hypothetical protein
VAQVQQLTWILELAKKQVAILVYPTPKCLGVVQDIVGNKEFIPVHGGVIA